MGVPSEAVAAGCEGLPHAGCLVTPPLLGELSVDSQARLRLSQRSESGLFRTGLLRLPTATSLPPLAAFGLSFSAVADTILVPTPHGL